MFSSTLVSYSLLISKIMQKLLQPSGMSGMSRWFNLYIPVRQFLGSTP